MASVIRFDETFSPILREVAEINPRFDRSAISDMSEPVSFVPMASVSEQTGSITSEVSRPISEVLKGFTPFRHGDVLVAKITPCFENGKIAHAAIERRLGFGSTEFHVVRAQPGVLNDRYLYHFLRLERIRLDGERKMTGSAGQRRVPKHFLENLRVPLPTLEEQRRIAAILDKADALRAKRREAIAKLDQLLQSVFLEMFGDPVANPKGWRKMTLEQLSASKFSNGIFRKNSEYTDAGTPVVWVDQLFRGREIGLKNCRRLNATQKELEKYGLSYGDVLFCRSSLRLEGIAFSNVFLGKARDSVFECHLIRMRPKLDLIDPVFLNQMLRTAPMRATFKMKSNTSTMTTIDQKALGSVEVITPPLEVQRRYSSTVKKLLGSEAEFEKQSIVLERLFGSIQQRAFTDQL